MYDLFGGVTRRIFTTSSPAFPLSVDVAVVGVDDWWMIVRVVGRGAVVVVVEGVRVREDDQPFEPPVDPVLL